MVYLPTTVLYFPHSTLAIVWKIKYSLFFDLAHAKTTIASYRGLSRMRRHATSTFELFKVEMGLPSTLLFHIVEGI